MPFWKRSEIIQLSKHFSSREMVCRCGVCSDQIIDATALQRLEALRETLGLPLTITSAFRCARYQQVLRSSGHETAKGVSSHEQGIAFDIVCSDMQRLVELAPKHFPNVGIAKSFVHVDSRAGGPRRWKYLL